MTPEDLAALRIAVQSLEHRGLAARLRARQGMSELNLSRTGKYWFWGIPRKELRFVALEDDLLIADAHGKTTLSGDGGGVG